MKVHLPQSELLYIMIKNKQSLLVWVKKENGKHLFYAQVTEPDKKPYTLIIGGTDWNMKVPQQYRRRIIKRCQNILKILAKKLEIVINDTLPF